MSSFCTFVPAVLAALALTTRHAILQEPASPAAPASPESHLVVLRSAGIEVGILPHAGGRVVLLRRAGGENILLSDPASWGGRTTPDPGPRAGFKAYSGHIIWVGPQSDWWNQQAITPENRNRTWPPDPWLEFGNYEIVAQTPAQVTLRGPDSPVTGLRLTKSVKIDDDGTVRLHAAATNIRDAPVTWQLWTNTRFDARTPAYVPVSATSRLRILYETYDAAGGRPMPYACDDGFFSFENAAPLPPGVPVRNGKAFLEPAEGVIAAFAEGGKTLFLKKAALVPQDKIHPSEAFVEIYSNVSPPGGFSLLELEFQGALSTIPPGGEVAFDETWQLVPYDGPATRAAHVAFLKKTGLGAGAKRED